MAGFTPPPVGDIADRRAVWEPIIGAAGTAQPLPPDVTTSDHYATADDGTKIPMRWYVKDGTTPGAAVLFFHGGGYIFGHIDLFDGPVSRYTSASGVPMLSVDYRRAPEHPFPTPLEDGYAALRWLHEHAANLGVDPQRDRRDGRQRRRRHRSGADNPRSRTRRPEDRPPNPDHADAG
jgi:acetyl esterase/lipase